MTQDELEAEYNEIMAHIGRVAVEFAQAEQVIDYIGALLVGDGKIYHILTERLMIGPKISNLKKISSVTLAPPLQEEVLLFLDNLEKRLPHRNESVHSIFGIHDDEIIKISRSGKGGGITRLSANEMFERWEGVYALLQDNLDLPEKIGEFMGQRRRAIMAMGQEGPTNAPQTSSS